MDQNNETRGKNRSEAIRINREVFKEIPPGCRVALIYHLRLQDVTAYRSWCQKSEELLAGMNGSRLFAITVDPAPREGMTVDEIVIDEYPSAEFALQSGIVTLAALTDCCREVTVLAILPEPAIKFRLVRMAARLIHFFNGINDHGTPGTTWQTDNPAVWPDQGQMAVARERDLDRALLVYNLNKNKVSAQYRNPPPGSIPCSGAQAYERYSKIAAGPLLRRGAYPVYGGRPLGLFIGGHAMLADLWDKFILVYYPQRRNLLAMIESEAFKKGQHHRDAGLERVAVFMGNIRNASTR